MSVLIGVIKRKWHKMCMISVKSKVWDLECVFAVVVDDFRFLKTLFIIKTHDGINTWPRLYVLLEEKIVRWCAISFPILVARAEIDCQSRTQSIYDSKPPRNRSNISLRLFRKKSYHNWLLLYRLQGFTLGVLLFDAFSRLPKLYFLVSIVSIQAEGWFFFLVLKKQYINLSSSLMVLH